MIACCCALPCWDIATGLTTIPGTLLGPNELAPMLLARLKVDWSTLIGPTLIGPTLIGPTLIGPTLIFIFLPTTEPTTDCGPLPILAPTTRRSCGPSLRTPLVHSPSAIKPNSYFIIPATIRNRDVSVGASMPPAAFSNLPFP